MNYILNKKNLLLASFSLTLGFLTYNVDKAVIYHLFPPKSEKNRMIKINDKTMSHESLEAKLGVSINGEYSEEMANKIYQTYTYMDKMNSNLFNSLKEIVVVPKTYNINYLGQAFFDYKMVLSEKATIDVIIHEAAHNYSYNMPNDFWKNWENISFGYYKNNYFPIFWAFVDRSFPIKEVDEKFIPKKGLLTDYSTLDKYEDIAEFVTNIYTENKYLTKVPKNEKELFIQKLALLLEYNFISEKMYKKSLRVLLEN